jgi:hypothetical protein
MREGFVEETDIVCSSAMTLRSGNGNRKHQVRDGAPYFISTLQFSLNEKQCSATEVRAQQLSPRSRSIALFLSIRPAGSDRETVTLHPWPRPCVASQMYVIQFERCERYHRHMWKTSAASGINSSGSLFLLRSVARTKHGFDSTSPRPFAPPSRFLIEIGTHMLLYLRGICVLVASHVLFAKE